MQFKKSQVLKKYGKSSESLREIKKAYFDDIELLVKREIETCDYYRQQKTREKCKNCNHKLSKTADFTKYDVGFVFCEKCNHLNGQYEDTNEFNNFIYTADGGERFQGQGGYVIDNESEYLYRVNSTDIVDLHRHLPVFLENINSSAKIYRCIDEKMQSLTDSLQLEIDKNHFTSDIHLVLRIK